METKKILIVSNFFYPEITPRAFRTTELVKEFCRIGHQVTLVLPCKSIYTENPLKISGLHICCGDNNNNNNNNIAQPFSNHTADKKQKKSTLIYSSKYNLNLLKKLWKFFFPPEIWRTYNRGITRRLIRDKNQYDLLISISQPISIHISSCFASIQNKNIRKIYKIAEFSDPLFKGKFWSVFPVYFLLGIYFSKFFNAFVTPTINSLNHFLLFKNAKNIHIIPQGFNIDDCKTKDYSPNKIPTFSYAGSFYTKLRNPDYFFQTLSQIKSNYKFIIYAPPSELLTTILNKYSDAIGDRIIIKDFIPRNDLIYELSGMDFLINFDNENSQMIPSKLIDYAIAKRPILSFNSKSFNPEVFNSFLKGIYNEKVNINLKDYEINKIAHSFLSIKSHYAS